MYEIPGKVARILVGLLGTVGLAAMLMISLDLPSYLAVIAGSAVTVVGISRWGRARTQLVAMAAFSGGALGLALFNLSPWGQVPPGIGIFMVLVCAPSTMIWWAVWGGRRDKDQRGKDGGA